LEFEQTVFYELFPALADSIHFDIRLSHPIPPMPIFDENDSLIGVDTTGMTKRLVDYEKRKAELNADSTRLVIAIKDSVFSIDEIDRKELIIHYEELGIKVDSSNENLNYLIDLTKLKTEYKKIHFKYLSEFPDKSEFWSTKYNFHLVGSTGFSRIQFDKTKSFGVLNSYYSCGRLCGGGYRIFIKNVKGKWEIDKIIHTWVA